MSFQIGENGTIENQDAVDFAAKTHELQTIIEKQVRQHFPSYRAQMSFPVLNVFA